MAIFRVSVFFRLRIVKVLVILLRRKKKEKSVIISIISCIIHLTMVHNYYTVFLGVSLNKYYKSSRMDNSVIKGDYNLTDLLKTCIQKLLSFIHLGYLICTKISTNF